MLESIKELFSVRSIDKHQYAEWLLKKHYAKRIPQVVYSFGLFENNNSLCGVCTFGFPCRMLNNGYGCFGGKIEVKTLELNRLVVNDYLPKNALSFFVSKCLSMLEKPMCIVSYADANNGHHGYIYQATNFIYCGTTKQERIFVDKVSGKIIHPRTIVSTFGSRDISMIPDTIDIKYEKYGKHKYFMFLGNKSQIKEMKKYFKYDILPYPKGDNKRYDSSYVPQIQEMLF